MFRIFFVARACHELDVACALPKFGAALVVALTVLPVQGALPNETATPATQTAVPPVGEPLTLHAALVAAEAYSQALPAQGAAALAARERAVAAGQRPDPVVRFGLDNVPVEGGADNLLTREPTTARSVGIVQALPDLAKRSARARRFEQDAQVAEARRQGIRSTLRRETWLAWLQAWTETRRVGLIDAQRLEADRAQSAADAAYRAGRGPQTDLFIARAMLARLADRRLQAEAAAINARASLRRWIGDAADRPLAIDASGPDAQSAVSPAVAEEAGVAGSAARLLAKLQDGDPELQLAAAREAAARSMADVAREERRADWSVDLRFQQRGPRYNNMVTLGFSIPLRWDTANRQDRELAARLAEVDQAEAETRELQRARRAEAERWLQSVRTGRARLDNLDSAQLPLATSRTSAALSAYRSGTSSLQMVFDARQAELALQLDRLQIELETASDQARLDTLTVRPNAPVETSR